jgi:hypothetical protein
MSSTISFTAAAARRQLERQDLGGGRADAVVNDRHERLQLRAVACRRQAWPI